MSNEQISATDKIKALITEAANRNINIEQAYLFGSYARNEQKEFSDIDVALVSDDFQGNSFLDSIMFDDIIYAISPELEIHTYKTLDFVPSNLFVKEILQTGFRVK